MHCMFTQEKFAQVVRMFLAAFLLPAVVVHGAGVTGAPKAAQRLHIIAVGINAYEWPNYVMKFQYARTDAISIAEAMKQSFEGPVESQVLLDEHATREGVQAAMDKAVAEAKRDDLFVFYFAGLSNVGDDKQFCLLTTKMRGPDKGNAECISANSLKAWMSRLQASNQLVILDAWKGEDLVATMVSRLQGKEAEQLKKADRRFMIIGTETPGLESNELKHGQFTFDFLKGLSGDADLYPKDGLITAGELDLYVRGQALVQSRTGAEVRTASASIGKDFIVARLKGIRGVGIEEARAPDTNLSSSGTSPGRDYALLIATDSYDSWQRLSNPIFDARAVAADLRGIYGFETEILENPTRSQVYEVLGKYMKMTYSDSDQLVIFMAGHGMYLDETREGFLITKDSRLPKQDKWGDSFLQHTRLRDFIEQIPAQHIFLILDACFGGTFDQRIAEAGRRGNEEYHNVSAGEIKNRKIKYKARRYLTSGGKEYVPDGRPGQHSPFARKLLEALRSYGGPEGYLTIEKILQYVEKVTPEPRAGEFGTNAPGGDLVLLPRVK